MQQISKVSAKKTHAIKRGKLHHMTITPSDNGGASIDTRYNAADGQDGADTMGGYDAREAALNEHTVHPHANSVAKHVKACLNCGKPMADTDKDGE